MQSRTLANRRALSNLGRRPSDRCATLARVPQMFHKSSIRAPFVHRKRSETAPSSPPAQLRNGMKRTIMEHRKSESGLGRTRSPLHDRTPHRTDPSTPSRRHQHSGPPSRFRIKSASNSPAAASHVPDIRPEIVSRPRLFQLRFRGK